MGPFTDSDQLKPYLLQQRVRSTFTHLTSTHAAAKDQMSLSWLPVLWFRICQNNMGTCAKEGRMHTFLSQTKSTRHFTNKNTTWVDVALELTSSNNTLASFFFVFIEKMYNNLSKRFKTEMVWAWTSHVKLNPLFHYGNVRLEASAKQTEATLIVWYTLMKSATPGLRNEIHA